MAELPALHVLMILGGTYPPSLGGGTELQVRTLALALRARGHHVSVLAPLTEPQRQKKVERIDGVPVCHLPYPRLSIIGGIWLALRLAALLWSRRDRYDAWHIHSPRRLSPIAVLVGHWVRKPQVVVKVSSAAEFDDGSLSSRPDALSWLCFRCLRHADAWQAISRRIASALAARGIPRERIAEIPNSIDTNRFRPRERNDVACVRFLFVGRLVAEKNLFTLLDAFAAMLLEHPQALLRIVGGGPLQTQLEQHASTLGTGSRVEFCGYRSDVEVLLSEADVGVLPSSVEGLSNALLECMAAGLPMIASRISGNEDLVHHGSNGWLFDPDDCAGLAACLSAAATMPRESLRLLGDEARATVVRHAGIDSVVGRMVRLYRGGQAPAMATSTTAGKEA